MVIRISDVRIGSEEEELVLAVLRSGNLAQGELVETFEREFAARHDVAHAVAVSNGTIAITAALQALGVGPGAEVITSPFTFVASLSAILSVGASARFADIGTDFNMDPSAVESLITPKTRAILLVHLYGQMADMDSIGAIAADAGVSLVEDAAQAVGARYRGRSAGSFGIGCFSLYATKNITTGEGGMVTTSSPEVADRLRLLRNHGMRSRYDYSMPGYNYRLTNIAAALGLPQLRRLDELTEARRRNAASIRRGLEGIRGLVLPQESTNCYHAYHQFTVRLTADAKVSREEFVAGLQSLGVETGIYYPVAICDLDCFRTDRRVYGDPVPLARLAAEQVVSLPVHQHLAPADLDAIVGAVTTVLADG